MVMLTVACGKKDTSVANQKEEPQTVEETSDTEDIAPIEDASHHREISSLPHSMPSLLLNKKKTSVR